jgi:hypothetical protein
MEMVSALAVALMTLSAGTDSKPVGEAIVAFAKANLGKKVGDGMCSSLAREALRKAGITSPGWGSRVESLERAEPGDILVFRDAEFAGREVHGRTITHWSMSFPNHVAIVSKVSSRGGKTRISLLHQNVGKRKSGDETRQVVKTWSFYFDDLQGGTVEVFRPGGR